MTPAAEMDSPVGRPVAENVRLSPSGSEKLPETSREMVSPSLSFWSAMAVSTVGAGLLTFQVKVSVIDPPSPSSAVTTTV